MTDEQAARLARAVERHKRQQIKNALLEFVELLDTNEMRALMAMMRQGFAVCQHRALFESETGCQACRYRKQGGSDARRIALEGECTA